MNLFSFLHFLLQIGEHMTGLVDSAAAIFSRLGYPQDQIEQVEQYIKGAIKIFLAIVKNILA